MNSSSTITIEFVSTMFAFALVCFSFGAWIAKLQGRIAALEENKLAYKEINRSIFALDVKADKLGDNLGRLSRANKRHINAHCHYISHIQSFLEETHPNFSPITKLFDEDNEGLNS